MLGGVLVEIPDDFESSRAAGWPSGSGRDITSDEGNRLLGIVRRSSGSVLTWRRAQLVLLSASPWMCPRLPLHLHL